MTPQEVQERLKLNQLKDKIWYVVPSCATTGEGLFEGLVSPPPHSRLDCMQMVADCGFRVGYRTTSRPRLKDRSNRSPQHPGHEFHTFALPIQRYQCTMRGFCLRGEGGGIYQHFLICGFIFYILDTRALILIPATQTCGMRAAISPCNQTSRHYFLGGWYLSF